MGFVDTFEPTNFQFFFIPRDHYRTLLKGLWPRPSRPNACKIRFFSSSISFLDMELSLFEKYFKYNNGAKSKPNDQT